MPKMLQVRNVPDRLHLVLRERALRRGKSLSAYLLDELERIAEELPLDEWLDEVHRTPPTRLRRGRAAAAVREGRRSR
jgi:antitoxin FitA